MKQVFSLIRLGNWGLKSLYSILDQGVFSGANFFQGVLLARWLSVEQFGAYSVSYTVLFFAYQSYTSFLLDPMSVIGPANYSNILLAYFRLQLRNHLFVSSLAGLTFLIVGSFFAKNQTSVRNIIYVMGFVLPFLLLPWFVRRIYYILGRPDISLTVSTLYALLLVLVMVILQNNSALSGSSSVVAMAFSGCFSSIYFLVRLKVYGIAQELPSFLKILKHNWLYGRWLVASGVFIAFSSQMQIWLSIVVDLDAAGVIRALQVVIQPMMLSITAITALITPTLSLDYSKSNFRVFNRRIFISSFTLLVLAVSFEIILLVFHVQLEKIFYDGKYNAYSSLIPVWGIIPIFLACSSGFQAGIQAAKKTYLLLLAAVIWTLSSYFFGIFFVSRFGLVGLSWSAVIGYFLFVLFVLILYWLVIFLPIIREKNKRGLVQ